MGWPTMDYVPQSFFFFFSELLVKSQCQVVNCKIENANIKSQSTIKDLWKCFQVRKNYLQLFEELQLLPSIRQFPISVSSTLGLQAPEENL